MLPEALRELADESSIISSETADKIDYEFSVDQMDEEWLEAVLSLFDAEPSMFRHLSAELYYPDDRAANNLLSMSVSSLEANRYTQDAVEQEKIASELANYYGRLAHRLDQGELEEISSDLIEFDSEQSGGVSMTFGFDKEIISNVISSELPDECEVSALTYWTSISQLMSWMEETDIEQIASKLFAGDHVPTLVTAHGTNNLDGLLPQVSLDDLDGLAEVDIPSKNSSYRDRMSEASELSTSNNPALAPDVFNTSFLREVFSKPFLYGFINCISEESTLSTNSISFLIASDKGTIDSSLSYPDWKDKGAEKTRLLEFYKEFKQRGSIPVYRDIWYKAIVEHCDGISDLSESKSDVVRYYRSLEEKAISGNFDELSGAVQDAQIFIGDVTNTLSTSTTNLTSEIQKLIFALFGVTAVNLFLILRKVGNELYLPFTVAICSVLLVFYFPTSQERISELRRVINEGGKDAAVYRDLVQKAGGEDLIDIQDFKERQESYINLGRNRADWADRQVRNGFIILTSAWGLSALASLIIFPTWSLSWGIAAASPLIAGIMIGWQKDRQYHVKVLDSQYSSLWVLVISVTIAVILTI